MNDASVKTAAVGFSLFFATCPVFFMALYPFRDATGLQVFFAAAMVGVCAAALALCARVPPPSRRSDRPPLPAGIVYLAGVLGFDLYCCAFPLELLGIVSGLAVGLSATPLMLQWMSLLAGRDLVRNSKGTGCLCGAGVCLSWLASFLGETTLFVCHIAACVLSVALLLAGGRNVDRGELDADGDAPGAESQPMGAVLSRMLSIAFLPLAGFVTATLFSSITMFAVSERIDLFGLDDEMLGYLLACAAIALIGALRPTSAPLSLLYRMIIPLGIVAALLVVAVREGQLAYELSTLYIMTLVAFLFFLAVAVFVTMCGTGEFDPRLVTGSMLVVYAVVAFVGFAMCNVADVAGLETAQAIMAVCLAALLCYQIVVDWKASTVPANAPEQGAPAGVDFAGVCARIGAEHGLTRREAEIFDYLARGYSQAYIASALTVSESTVRTHVKHIYRKLQVNSREEVLDIVNEAAAAPRS